MHDDAPSARDGFALELVALLVVWSILPFNGGFNELIWGEQSISPNFWAQELNSVFTMVADLLILFAFAQRAGLGPHGLGFRKPSLMQLFFSLPAWAVMAAVMGLSFEFADRFTDFAKWAMDSNDWPARTVWEKGFQVWLFVPLSALAEEVFYRGYLVGRLRQRGWRTRSIILLSAVAFAVPHYDGGPVKVFATFIVGALFALGYARIGNLWPLIFGHVAHNMLLHFH